MRTSATRSSPSQSPLRQLSPRLPAGDNITETVTLPARMARFIIADLTDPSSVPQELQAIVAHLAKPVQPLLEGASRPEQCGPEQGRKSDPDAIG